MIHKELVSILGITLEPVATGTETKAVSPGIHVEHEPVTTDTVDLVGQNDLQVAHRGFFEIVSTRIAIQPDAPVFRHADQMTGFVEQ